MKPSASSENNVFLSGWEQELNPYACSSCQGVFLVPAGQSYSLCPYCYQSSLMALGGEMFLDQELYTNPPEGYLAAEISREQLKQQLKQFEKSILFSSKDCSTSLLLERLRLLYLPFWWVDVQIQSKWFAEMGFDYQVVSHQEYLSNGKWKTKETQRTKTRWEERLGTLERSYENTPAPALEHWPVLLNSIGGFPLHKALPFQAEVERTSAYQLPSLVPKEAWPETEIQLHELAARDCMKAADAQHIRRFQWSPTFRDHSWTQLLVPVYTTHYMDENNDPQPVLIHGLTGQLLGRKRASIRKAKRIAFVIGGILFASLAGIVFWLWSQASLPLAELMGIGLFVAILISGLMLSIVRRARSFNEQQPKRDIWH